MTGEVLLLDDEDLELIDDATRLVDYPPEVRALICQFKMGLSSGQRIEIGVKLAHALRGQESTELWDLLETGMLLSQLSTVVEQINVTNIDKSIKQTFQGDGQQVVANAATDGSTATVDRVSQQLAPGEFSGEALKAEVHELLSLVAQRLEALEAADRPDAMAAVTALRGVDFAKSQTEQDALQMLNELWDDAMKKRYSPVLGKVVEAIGKQAGPMAVAFIKSAIATVLA